MREAASRMAAVFRARTLLSTTGGGVESAPHSDLLEWSKVEILQYSASFALGKGPVISLDQRDTIAEDPIRQRRRGFVKEDEIDWPAGRALEIGDKRACLACVE
jgi:hypothetical protein